jgi:AraC family transcriptional regulator
MVVYDSNHFVDFSPSNLFERWAAVEVSSYEFIPAKMETFDLVEGLYAIFDYIFEEWLPRSIYELDDRPHFEVLGENYKNNDPNSEEEIWIPIKVKS